MDGVDLLDDGLVHVQRLVGPETPGYASEAPLAADRGGAQTPTPPLGFCSVCKERPAARRCVNCGNGACTQDLWTMLGLCKTCASDDEVRRAREGDDRKRPELGIKWIED